MRRATVRRASSRNLLDRIRVRQVFPLWRRDRASGRNARITAEQPSRVVTRPNEVGELDGGKGIGLPIAGHIDCIWVVTIDRDRKMYGSLSAGVDSLDSAISLQSPRQIHRGPRRGARSRVVAESDVLSSTADYDNDV